jgi:hypothetical protein
MIPCHGTSASSTGNETDGFLVFDHTQQVCFEDVHLGVGSNVPPLSAVKTFVVSIAGNFIGHAFVADTQLSAAYQLPITQV